VEVRAFSKSGVAENVSLSWKSQQQPSNFESNYKIVWSVKRDFLGKDRAKERG